MKVSIQPEQYHEDGRVTITVSSDKGVGPDILIETPGIGALEICLSVDEALMLSHVLAVVS